MSTLLIVSPEGWTKALPVDQYLMRGFRDCGCENQHFLDQMSTDWR
jgi:hypothetical protein